MRWKVCRQSDFSPLHYWCLSTLSLARGEGENCLAERFFFFLPPFPFLWPGGRKRNPHREERAYHNKTPPLQREEDEMRDDAIMPSLLPSLFFPISSTLGGRGTSSSVGFNVPVPFFKKKVCETTWCLCNLSPKPNHLSNEASADAKNLLEKHFF